MRIEQRGDEADPFRNGNGESMPQRTWENPEKTGRQGDRGGRASAWSDKTREIVCEKELRKMRRRRRPANDRRRSGGVYEGQISEA